MSVQVGAMVLMRMGSFMSTMMGWRPRANPVTACLAVAVYGKRESINKLVGLRRLTVVDCSASLDTHGRSVDDDAAALGLLAQVVQAQGHCVHDTLLADIDQVIGGLLEVTVLVDLSGEVVGTGAETSVGEHVVDASVKLLSLLEQGVELGPVRYVGLDPGVMITLRSGGRGDIAVDNKCSEREQQLDGSQADT